MLSVNCSEIKKKRKWLPLMKEFRTGAAALRRNRNFVIKTF